MNSAINNILGADEKIVWQGIVNRKAIVIFLLISLIITTLIGLYFFG